jgi:hypothetical protein
MIEYSQMTERFTRWLDEALQTLTTSNSIDVHVDELSDRNRAPQGQLDASVALFRWIVSSLGGRLAGRIVMLMIPLQSGDDLDLSVPAWESLASQLSATPPSIYVMEATAFLQPDPAQRYLAPIRVSDLGGDFVAAYYQCWRNPEDLEDEGWARDIRVAFTGFLRR